MEYRLFYSTPAQSFSEALPVGNGRMGAMVYGKSSMLHISLNEDTLWSGKFAQQDHVIVPEEIRETVRELLKKEKYWDAQELVQNTMLSQKYNESYISAGFLDCSIGGVGKIETYGRSLNMNTACVSTKAEGVGRNILTESFISCSEDVLVTHISSTEQVDISVALNSHLRHLVKCENGMVLLQGEAPEHVEPNYVNCDNAVVYGDGMKYTILTKVHSTDGALVKTDQSLIIKNARECTLLTTIETGYCGWNQPLLNDWSLLNKKGREKLDFACQYDYETLKKRHEEIHKSYFERVNFHIEDTENSQHNIPTDVRTFGEKKDLEMYELLFQYGRYLMICSSRPVDRLSQPANLQGIWCEDVRSVWSSNWTVNINTEMNYWLNGPCALAECEMPLIHMIEEVAKTGKSTARETLGADGWATCHNVDLWRQTTPVKGEVKWSYWPMGGVWLTTHLYRHYLYTNDKNYLKKIAWPVMKETASFCLSRLLEENGKVYTDFSTSPENTFLDQEGRECALCKSVTMDVALIREIFLECIETCKVLEVDWHFQTLLEKNLARLPEYQTGRYGQLLEWEKDFSEKDELHRHFAHLVGFHPFHQIDFDTRRELLGAVEQVLKRRTREMKYYIGWGEAWLSNFYARLRKGNEAEKHLELFLKHCCYGNLLGLHPPLGESSGEREIFQIDGNFGITAGIGEMLLQSKRGVVDILPALPDDWKEGKLTGMVAVGGHKLDLFWKQSKLEKACICGGCSESLLIRCSTEFVYCDEGRAVLRSESTADGWKMILEVKEQETYCLYAK